MNASFKYWFLPAYAVLLMAGILYVIFNPHGELVLVINQHHTPFLDQFFKYTTYLGDGRFIAGIVVLLLILRWRYGLILGAIGVTLSIVSYLLKRVIFKGTPRPRTFFEDAAFLNFVEGVQVHGYNAFPSGHTMTAFALATFLALYLNNRIASVILLVLAVLAGISRIYLLQHFLVDVVVGSLLGVLLAAAGWYLFRNFTHKSISGA